MSTRLHPERTLKEELKASFALADMVKVPWVVWAFDNNNTSDAGIRSAIRWRWNHSLHHGEGNWKTRDRYDAIETKALFRVPAFRKCVPNSHTFVEIQKGSGGPTAVDSVWRKPLGGLLLNDFH